MKNIFHKYDLLWIILIFLAPFGMMLLGMDSEIDESLAHVSANQFTLLFLMITMAMSLVSLLIAARSHVILRDGRVFALAALPMLIFFLPIGLGLGPQSGQFVSDIHISFLLCILLAMISGVVIICLMVITHFKRVSTDAKPESLPAGVSSIRSLE